MRPICLFAFLAVSSQALAAEPNSWVKLDGGQIDGRRWDVPVAYSPELKRFVVLGGRMTFADAKKPRSYDVLSLDPGGKWRNEFPADAQDWGPDFGAASPPGWKDERWGFRDSAGNTRPNWSVYGTFSLGGLYAHDPDSDSICFYAGGNTFRYMPKSREWFDLNRQGPAREGGTLLWSSMAYDRSAKKYLLFGGGNIQSERGDPGTWLFALDGRQWEKLNLAVQPPQRANSRLAHDPVNKLTVLFGGDRLDQLVADTWLFDSSNQTWTERKPRISPSPRAGHVLLWLPKAKKILLLGGYTYTSTTDYVAPLYRPLPFEAWTYDVAKDVWELIARWDKDAPVGPANTFLAAAADDNDTILVLDSRYQAWTCKVDATRPDEAGAAKHGAAPGTTTRRTGSHDPTWYTEGVAKADPVEVAARLAKLPANRWVELPTPNRPRMNMDWGSAVFDPANDRILRFSGGHSAYSGTAPFVYDVKTDRYSLPFAPEYPIEYVYSNDQVRGEWSFQGRPWMTGHTYKSTGFEPGLKSMIFVAHDYTYSFDAIAGKWSRLPARNPFRTDMYTNTVCTTPEGAIVWAMQPNGRGPGLWRFHASTREWKPLRLAGKPEFPAMSPDRHGLAFDSKRNRLLFFSDAGAKKGNVAAYNLKTAALEWLNPAGADKALAPCRETVYLPEADMVLVGARVKLEGGHWRWLAFDCAKNAWVALDLGGDDPFGKKLGAFNNSMGLMFDPNRKLVWAVGQHSQVYAIKLDAAKAQPLK